MPSIKIKKDEAQPESVELLAQSIVKISNGFEQLLKLSLTEAAYIVLLQNMIGNAKISKQQIKLVLNNLPRLKAWYVKK